MPSANPATDGDRRYLSAIAGRMVADNAVDTSDAEIERTLGPCVLGPNLIPMAKRLRDSGELDREIVSLRQDDPTVTGDPQGVMDA